MVIDWNKDLFQPIYGRVVRGSPILGWITHSLIRAHCPWYFTCKYIGSYVIFIRLMEGEPYSLGFVSEGHKGKKLK